VNPARKGQMINMLVTQGFILEKLVTEKFIEEHSGNCKMLLEQGMIDQERFREMLDYYKIGQWTWVTSKEHEWECRRIMEEERDSHKHSFDEELKFRIWSGVITYNEEGFTNGQSYKTGRLIYNEE
jgi:hypothetical protein